MGGKDKAHVAQRKEFSRKDVDPTELMRRVRDFGIV